MEWLFVVGYGSFPHSPLSTIKAANMSSLFQDSDLMVHSKWVSLPSMILRRRQRYAVSLQGEEACLAQLVSCPTQLNSGSVNPSEKTIKSTIESISSHQPELLPLMKVDPNPKNTENPSYKFSWDPHGPTLPSPPHLKAMAPRFRRGLRGCRALGCEGEVCVGASKAEGGEASTGWVWSSGAGTYQGKC